VGINSSDEVLATNSSGLPFLYLAGREQLLPQPSGGVFAATALNDFGQVTGYVDYDSGFNCDLSIYSHGNLTVMTNLSGLSPFAINDAGQISGDWVSKYLMFFYSNGALTQIGHPARSCAVQYKRNEFRR
jgi:hypothetical protein